MMIHHTAGKVEGTIQKCSLCGKVLITGLENGKGFEEGDQIGDIQEVGNTAELRKELAEHLLGNSKPSCKDVIQLLEGSPLLRG